MVEGTVEQTAANLGPDAGAYRRLMEPLVDGWQGLLRTTSSARFASHRMPC